MSGLAEMTTRLVELLGDDRLERRYTLAPLTTFRIGGPSDLFYEARSADELAHAVVSARAARIPFFVLGLGANILVSDKGYRGLVIRNRARSQTLDRETGILESESGAIVWPDSIETAVRCGWSGLEHFAGIPSTVGGALWQNLHFLSPPPDRERTVYIEEVVSSADLLTPDDTLIKVGVEYFQFGYDRSILHSSGDTVLTVRFSLSPGDPDVMRQTVSANLAWRSKRHPPLDSEPSAGSIFQKIDGIGAGRLIDECGLKGTRIGGAEVSSRHANIIINRGGATAADVRALIDQIQERVYRSTGHALTPEISFIGEF